MPDHACSWSKQEISQCLIVLLPLCHNDGDMYMYRCSNYRVGCVFCLNLVSEFGTIRKKRTRICRRLPELSELCALGCLESARSGRSHHLHWANTPPSLHPPRPGGTSPADGSFCLVQDIFGGWGERIEYRHSTEYSTVLLCTRKHASVTFRAKNNNKGTAPRQGVLTLRSSAGKLFPPGPPSPSPVYSVSVQERVISSKLHPVH